MADAAETLKAALSLEPDQRARLIEALSESLAGVELSPEWEAELTRRLEELDTGRVETIASEEVFARLDQRLGRR